MRARVRAPIEAAVGRRFLIALLGGLALAGCGSSDSEVDAGPTTSQSTDTTEESAPEPARTTTPEEPLLTRTLVSRGSTYIFLELREESSWGETSYSYRAFFQTPGKPATLLATNRCERSALADTVRGTRLPDGRLALLSHVDLGFELEDDSFHMTTLHADPPDPRAREPLAWVLGMSDLAGQRELAALALVQLGDMGAAPILEQLLRDDGRTGPRNIQLVAAHARLTRDTTELRDLVSLLRLPEYLRDDALLAIVSACPPGLPLASPRIRAELARRPALASAIDLARQRCARDHLD